MCTNVTRAKYFLMACISLMFLLGENSALASELLWGVNGHPVGNPVFADYEKQFDIMRQNHLTTYRMDVALSEADEKLAIAQLRVLIPLAKKWGITLRPVLTVAFHWGDRTDTGHYPAGDPQALYRQGFDHVYNFVRLFKDDIQDWELENETNLLVHDWRGVSLYGRGWTAQEFDTPLMHDWNAVLKGMSDAIGKINDTNGTKLRRVLGTTSTNFGFIDYMLAHGVNFEVLGYHQYVHLGESPYKAWSKATPRFNLFQKLASYGRPVHFTEVNAAEIYDKKYKNKEDDAYTRKGYQSLSDELAFLKNQKDMPLEEVDVYEIFDDPGQKDAEARFGIMYDAATPKAALAIVGQVSGSGP
jgi:hypothetical protein